MLIRNIVANVSSVLDLDADQVEAALEAFFKTPCRLKALITGESRGIDAGMMNAIRLYFLSCLWGDEEFASFRPKVVQGVLNFMKDHPQLAPLQAYLNMLREHNVHPALRVEAVQSATNAGRSEM